VNKIFITGANGFVGKHLIEFCKKKNIPFVAGTRSLYGDLTTQTNWEEILNGCDSIVHLAARVHVMKEKDEDPLKLFRKANVEATLALANAAKKKGVRKFIYISSIKAVNEVSKEFPLRLNDTPMPQDPYGISKLEAEQALMKLHSEGNFEVVIIRPPLVYGKGVKANFEKLFWLVKKDLPLPFGKVNNKRSMVSVLNLCDFIIHCIYHPQSGGQTFFVSDGIDYSLKDILLRMGEVENKHPHLLPIPIGFMKFGASLLGKKAYADRLFGNLHVDISKNETLLGWTPKFSFKDTYLND